MVWPIVVAGAAAVVGSLISAAQNEKDSKRQQQLLDRARDEFAKIETPEQKELFFEELKNQGVYSPELEQIFTAPQTKMVDIAVDPKLKQAQMDALASLREIGTSGLTTQDRLDIERSRQEQGAIANRQAANIMEGLTRRGMADSGLNAVLQQQNAQAQMNSANNFERDINAQAKQRALQALMQGGTLAGNIRGQEFNEESAKAQAMDAINMFNTRNQQAITGANVDRRNVAQQSNLNNQQRIADANVGIRNQQQQLNAGAGQRQFENEMARASGMNSTTNSYLDYLKDKKKDNSEMWSGIIQGVGKGADSWNKGGNK